MKKNKNINELDLKEYRGVFSDTLESHVRNTFKEKEHLLFVSYQPSDLYLNHQDVVNETKAIFEKFPYVEVIEQTFIQRKMYNDGKFINGYHSHILMKESDYATIESQLNAFDIKEKVVWGLDGIYKYLSKQAGLTHTRILPIKNNPVPLNAEINNTCEEIKPPAKRKIIKLVHNVVKKIVHVVKDVVITPLLKGFANTVYGNDG